MDKEASTYNKNAKITFNTLSGPLVVERGTGKEIKMELPSREAVQLPDERAIKPLIKAVIGNTPLKEVVWSPVAKKLVLRLDDAITRGDVEKLDPIGCELISAYNAGDILGVIVTLKGSTTNGCINENGSNYDFVSRYFAPWVGIHEDPVTGSAHAVLGPYWGNILAKKQLFACQCSKREGKLQLDINEIGNTVTISGQFFTYVSGHVRIQ